MMVNQQMNMMWEHANVSKDEREERSFCSEEQRGEHHMQLQMQQQFMTTMMMMAVRTMFSSPTMSIPPYIPLVQRGNNNDCSEGKEEEHEDMNQEGKEEE